MATNHGDSDAFHMCTIEYKYPLFRECYEGSARHCEHSCVVELGDTFHHLTCSANEKVSSVDHAVSVEVIFCAIPAGCSGIHCHSDTDAIACEVSDMVKRPADVIVVNGCPSVPPINLSRPGSLSY